MSGRKRGRGIGQRERERERDRDWRERERDIKKANNRYKYTARYQNIIKL